MDVTDAKKAISRMNQETFWKFFGHILSSEYKSDYSPFEEFSSFENPYLKSYRGIYRPSVFSFYQYYWIFDYFPYLIFQNIDNINLVSENLLSFCKYLKKTYPYKEGYGSSVDLGDLYFINNLNNIASVEYSNKIFPQYEKLVKETIAPNCDFGVGNIDTILSNDPKNIIQQLSKFLLDNDEGLTIQITKDSVIALEISSQNYIENGVTKQSKSLLEPVFSIYTKRKNLIIEFNNILKTGDENQIESFLKDSFQEVFGNHYLRCETQLWLKSEEIDDNKKNRRLDIFLRNGITEDWDLFEIKKDLKINTHFRDLDTFTSTVYKSIEQIRNYAELLNNDKIKAKLKKEGIEYFSPSLNLVIGTKPKGVTNTSWRKLIQRNSNEVKIITYDSLIKEMEFRLNEFENLIFNDKNQL